MSMRMPFRLSTVIWILLLALLVAQWSAYAQELKPWRGGPAPALALSAGDGTVVNLADFRGKVVVVNFWATWCVPCREEMPEFVKAQRELGDRGLQFVGIAADDAAKVKAFADELGLNYPALIGGYGAIELSKSLGNQVGALPYTLFIDRSGRISRTHLGPIKPAELKSIVGQLLG